MAALDTQAYAPVLYSPNTLLTLPETRSHALVRVGRIPSENES